MTDQILPAILKCRICDDAADGQHFGVDACRACAAFFRRTVARDMKYICSFENNCEISKVYRSMCRSCRLQKCFKSGMKKESVQISRTSVPNSNSRQEISIMSGNVRRSRPIAVKEEPRSSKNSVNRQSVSSVNSNLSLENTYVEHLLRNDVPLDEEELSNKEGNFDAGKSNLRGNACRACRLQCMRACHTGGNHRSKDNIQTNFSSNNQYPIPNEIFTPATFTSNQQGIHKSQIVITLLERYRDGFLDFTNGQRSLYSVKSASTIFAEIKYKPLKYADWKRMNQGSAFLLRGMCINYFEPFNILPQDKKVEILKKYWPTFTFLHRAYLTVAALPYLKKASQDGNATSNNGSKHVVDKYVSHHGYYTDKNQTRELFEAMNLDRDDCEKGVRFCEALLDINLCLIDQFYELNPSEMEFVAMVAIFFWNTVDNLGHLNADMRRQRDTVFQELNSILTDSLGTVNGSVRFGRIICFMHKLTEKIIEMYESVTVVKIFLPQLQDMCYEEIVPK